MATWTQAEYDALKAAVATGVLTVRFDGPPARMVTYQSTEQMRALLAEMGSYLGKQSGTGTSYRLATISKGL